MSNANALNPTTALPEREKLISIVPARPIIVPAIANPVTLCLNKNAPIIMVNRGVNVLSMPATELSIRVWAVAKRKDGINMPIMPEAKSFQKLPGLILVIRVIAIGAIKSEAAATRKAPTSSGANTLRPCLIRMNEVPQIRVSNPSKI